jgi:hypothetical protein
MHLAAPTVNMRKPTLCPAHPLITKHATLCVYCVCSYSWEGVFWIYGALGLLWLALWAPLAKDTPPRAHALQVAQAQAAALPAAPSPAALGGAKEEAFDAAQVLGEYADQVSAGTTGVLKAVW